MELIELSSPEDKIELNFEQFHKLTAEAVKHDLLMNGIKCDVPHAYLREVMTGEKEEGIQATGIAYPARKNLLATGQQAPKEASATVGDVTMYAWKQSTLNWDGIKKIIREGQAEESLPPGTKIRFILKDGKPAKAVVVGINHYNKHDAVFRLVEPLTIAGMNKEHTNAGGWNKCEARRLLNKDIFRSLPNGLQAIITRHTTLQKINGEAVTSRDFLFLPSEFEITGQSEYAEYNGVDKVFDYLKERMNRLIVDEYDVPRSFWTADPSVTHDTKFCAFAGNGESGYDGAAYVLALTPLFVIQ